MFDSYFLSICYVLHMVLGTGNPLVNNAYKPLTLMYLTFLSRSPIISKEIGKVISPGNKRKIEIDKGLEVFKAQWSWKASWT